MRAIYALGLDAVTPADARLQAQIDWLMAHRTGHRWSPDKATGPAMLAVCRWFARSQFDSDKYKLKIYVNDFLAKEAGNRRRAPTQSVDVPAELLKGTSPSSASASKWPAAAASPTSASWAASCPATS